MGITSACLAKITQVLADQFGYMAVGSSSTAFSRSQTALGAEITANGLGRKACTVTRTTTTYTNDTLQFSASWTCTGGINYVNEVGVFDSSSGGTMGSRDLTSSTRVVTAGYTLSETVKWIFS